MRSVNGSGNLNFDFVCLPKLELSGLVAIRAHPHFQTSTLTLTHSHTHCLSVLLLVAVASEASLSAHNSFCWSSRHKQYSDNEFP